VPREAAPDAGLDGGQDEVDDPADVRDDPMQEQEDAPLDTPNDGSEPIKEAALWHLNEGAGVEAIDSSGAGNTATLQYKDLLGKWVQGVGANALVWVQEGVSGSALHFEGKDGRLFCPDSPSLHLTGDFSVELWVKFDVLGESQMLLDNGLARVFYRGGTWGNRIFFDILTTSGSKDAPCFEGWTPRATLGSSTLMTVNQWIQLVGTRSGDVMTLYVNGTQEVQKVCLSGGVIDTSALSDIEMGDPGFTGTLDEIAIYPRALTESEVFARYQQVPTH
jgi:hypothetical protein